MVKKGITIVELLVVLVIIAIIAAIVFPVLRNAKRSSHRAVATSNMRQCLLSITLYSDEMESLRSLPNYDSAVKALAQAPTCDLEDYWRSSCKEPFRPPLIGSFAYVRAVMPFDGEMEWDAYLSGIESLMATPSVFISIFYSSNRIVNAGGFGPAYGTSIPDLLLIGKADGSVRVRSFRQPTGISVEWSSLFLR